MKTNRFLRAAAVLLVIALPSFAFLTTTMARYTTQAQLNATARVATWNPTAIHQFGPGVNDVVLFFPGRTAASPANVFHLQNNSQVACRFYADLTASGHVSWSVDDVVDVSHDFVPNSTQTIGSILYNADGVTITNTTAVERLVNLTLSAVQID